jgi:tetratricopeptide (TPR) repeat protein
MNADTLKLILSYRDRMSTTSRPDGLEPLFERLGSSGLIEGETIESAIWQAWMSHADPGATALLEAATDAIVAGDYPEAERLLDSLVRTRPEFAEAWNKRATLYYLMDRDDESLADLQRVLDLEPRHFGAMCHFAQICLAKGDAEAALYALDTALRLNPHLDEARATARKLLRERTGTIH